MTAIQISRYHRWVDIEMIPETGTDPAKHPVPYCDRAASCWKIGIPPIKMNGRYPGAR